jgi:hypothetical protein
MMQQIMLGSDSQEKQVNLKFAEEESTKVQDDLFNQSLESQAIAAVKERRKRL